jgi:uncharacterized membrane protein (UPF0127 family)
MSSDFERIDRGQRAEAALKEFLDPAFDVIIADYTRRVMSIAAETPWETAKITKLSAAVKIAETARQQIRELVADGFVAGESLKQMRQMERLTTEQRKWLAVRA